MSCSTAETSRALIATSVLEFLLIEAVPLSQRLSDESTQEVHSEGTEEDPTLQGQTAVQYRLETMGQRIGAGLATSLTRDHPRFTDSLDVIKFICKDLWVAAFRKQVDNLKTNHRGVFVLSDLTFWTLRRMSLGKNDETELLLRAQPYLWLPCGIIQGALEALGVRATVLAESVSLPTVTFQIKTTTGLQI